MSAPEAPRRKFLPWFVPVPRCRRTGAPTRCTPIPVVALDPGVAGAEIRVRIVRGVRVLRARILTARAVAILAAGA